MQLLSGCTESELSKLRLVRDPAAYYFTDNGNNNKAPTSDKSDYKTVNSAMSMLGFSPNETQTVWSIIAGILHLVIDVAINRIDSANKFLSNFPLDNYCFLTFLRATSPSGWMTINLWFRISLP